MDILDLLGLDIGKNTFHLIGHDAKGKEVLRKKFNRNRLLEFVARLKPCTIAMESCGGSHWLARKLISFGHQVKLIAPQHVKPYGTGNKNDYINAEAKPHPVLKHVTSPSKPWNSKCYRLSTVFGKHW